MEMIDCIGVPEFFITKIGKIEYAGGNCFRLYCCIARDDVLIPQFTIVAPGDSLAAAAKHIEQAALNAFNKDMAGSTAH